MILIVYTTQYRKGSDMFARVAETMRTEISERFTGEVVCRGIVHKKELVTLFAEIAQADKTLDEFHFIGHAGMYGPMYGTVAYPEQFSPYELKHLSIPFSKKAQAYFHCCRSARWFAQFFATLFQVETYGYYWYTAFSTDMKKYKKVQPNSKKVYAVGCPGKKSHGLFVSLKKQLGLQTTEDMKSFVPRKQEEHERTYHAVAELYNAVFQDITVRRDEWKWLEKHLPARTDIQVVDIGCGNGALLKQLAGRIERGTGLDISPELIHKATLLNADNTHIEFKHINGPQIPLPDHSVDVITSLLSFRYLDWDPLMDEIKRVLKPGGKVLIVDMVTVPVKWYEIPQFVTSKIRSILQRVTHRTFYTHLKKLVHHPAWQEMLRHNPIRTEHEMKWYLESRFPDTKVEKINVGWNSCILAFDSGNIESMQDIYLTYP